MSNLKRKYSSEVFSLSSADFRLLLPDQHNTKCRHKRSKCATLNQVENNGSATSGSQRKGHGSTASGKKNSRLGLRHCIIGLGEAIETLILCYAADEVLLGSLARNLPIEKLGILIQEMQGSHVKKKVEKDIRKGIVLPWGELVSTNKFKSKAYLIDDRVRVALGMLPGF
eukprot:CAMPEP_0114503850 /NCGR_PEP_ID=MMETSP0109-20121206/9874_1 /TAXON_ID=29199 /ORGANISM="Chlorarachnion reptans, Strain CCCM449" /LENGTH=169 /DNA_ID=CAMNT_0001681919 /DNA_START=59 /DNA_END=568 /DNA_ORIENTATION=+